MVSQLKSTAERLAVAGQDPRITYWLAVPGRRQAVYFKQELQASGARFYNDLDLLDVLAEVVVELEPDETSPERRARLDCIAQHRERFDRALQIIRALPFDPAVPGKDELEQLQERSAELAQIEDLARRQSAAYRQALASRNVYFELQGVVAAELFLMAWDGPELELKRNGDRLSQASLAAIPLDDLVRIGGEILALVQPPPAFLGNSPSGSGPAAAPSTSSSAATAPESSPTSPDGTSRPSASGA